MEVIDVKGLPEETARKIKDLVDVLKQGAVPPLSDLPDEWAALSLPSFTGDWDNDKDSVYDHWHEKYHV
ncbi:hypothetical protein [Candidatus Magnetominusculus dajiuhuensis]|uniref:hypothetical protein n=1 Tax=Candidatus Magnetominusculus dajiuhuensis TaxID=3137712 RepID=UPI003B43AECA